MDRPADRISRASIGLALLAMAGAVALASETARAQASSLDVVELKARVEPSRASPGDRVSPGNEVELVVDFKIKAGWHIYAPDHAATGIPTKVSIDTTVLAPAGSLRFPEPTEKRVEILDETHRLLTGEGTLRQKMRVADDATAGAHVVALRVRLQACDKSSCRLPAEAKLKATLQVASATESSPKSIGAGGGPGKLESLLELTLSGSGVDNAPSDEPGEVVALDTKWSVDRALPGAQIRLAIVLDIAATYHINPPAGKSSPEAYPTSVRVVEAPGELTLEQARFPPPHDVTVSYAETPTIPSYEGRTIFVVPMKVADDASPSTLKLAIEVEYQACDATQCLFPTTKTLHPTIEIVAAGATVKAINAELFNDSTAGDFSTENTSSVGPLDIDPSTGVGFLLLLLVSALGGALLNFTPCVLPVIPIKIMSLAQSAENRARCLVLGAAMCVGVIVFWVVLGGLIAGVGDFAAINQLFQYPAFTFAVGVVIAIMAVGMCGLFSIQLPGFINRINPGHDSLRGSFGLGVMTAVLSTPCTAPFMGATAAWAATQNATTTLITFASIGAGMALPYLILSASPGLARKMPRTGAASVLIKESMGLFMLAAAAYFIGVGLSALVVSPPDSPSRIYWWPVMALVGAAGTWLAYRTFRITVSPFRRTIFGGTGLAVLVLAILGGLELTAKGPIDWVNYTPERFEKAIDGGKVVVIDFTAEWCLNCKALEHGVLNTDSVATLLNDERVVPIKVDLTGTYAPAKEKLKEVGRLTIPLLVIYAPGGREVFKSDLYTVIQVVTAVEDALKEKKVSLRP